MSDFVDPIPALVRQKWWSHPDMLALQLERLRIDLVLDVGANEGQFAQKLRSFYKGRLISFEPVKAVFDVLSRAAARDDLWQVQNVALGREEDKAVMNVPSSTVFSSMLRPNAYSTDQFGEDVGHMREESVRVRRLTDVLGEIVPDIENARIFLKIDTQGYDLEVFSGIGALEQNILLLQSEVSLLPIYQGMPTWAESLATFEKGGFRVAGLFPVSWSASTFNVIEYDCLLTKENGAGSKVGQPG